MADKPIIGINTKLTPNGDYTKDPGKLVPRTVKKGDMNDFLKYSRESIEDYNLTDDKKALVQQKIDQGSTLRDAIFNVDDKNALHVLEDVQGYDYLGGPAVDNYINVDTLKMREAVGYLDLDDITKDRYNRAINVLAHAYNRGFKLAHSSDDRYWFESEEDGQKVYALNGLVEVREVLNALISAQGDGDGKKTTTETMDAEKKDYDEIPVEALTAKNFTWSLGEKLYLASIGVDLGSTVVGIAGRAAGTATAPTGVGAVVGIGGGALVSLIGGLLSTGLDLAGDYSTGMSNSDMAKRAGTRLGFELAEVASFGVPVSVLAKFRKGATGYKLITKLLKYGAVVAAGSTVFDGERNTEVFRKFKEGRIEELDLDDVQHIANLAMIAAGIGSSKFNRKKLNKSAEAPYHAYAKKHSVEGITNKIKGSKSYKARVKNLDIDIEKIKKRYVAKSPGLKKKFSEVQVAVNNKANKEILSLQGKKKNLPTVSGPTSKARYLPRVVSTALVPKNPSAV